MSSGRRTSTLQEIQKRQRLQPVQCWAQEWVKPRGALPGSAYKVLKWVKSEQKQHFSDDEDNITENPAAAVVDEELEDSRLASELPDAEALIADEGEVDENEDQEGAPAPIAPTDALKSIDSLDPLDQAKKVEEEDEVGDVVKNSAPEADPDVLPLGDENLMPTSASSLIPAPDGSDLDEMAQEQLIADAAAAFAGVSPDLLDGSSIQDGTMDFTQGSP